MVSRILATEYDTHIKHVRYGTSYHKVQVVIKLLYLFPLIYVACPHDYMQYPLCIHVQS